MKYPRNVIMQLFTNNYIFVGKQYKRDQFKSRYRPFSFMIYLEEVVCLKNIIFHLDFWKETPKGYTYFIFEIEDF